ncbi:AraC family transcriptional regulator [Alcanivorax sediminis]|uniref:Helix-turn-helix domain-containing protein n=1 Tax=Alcanivorax sediminis TaxID=2663008 RepID=A0A6N7LTQ8_9GAMM|nr:AraC family transcriptional regulator [Alcanivorax sediminis]MQX53672.1 helix-turn-helix domain-containing protein [Alcanivorax sediminis]
MSDLGEISSAALQQYLAHADKLGLDTAAALIHAGIDPEQALRPEARIDGREFQRLLQRLADQSGDPLFGLHTSAFIQPGSYNVMGYISMSVHTLHEALLKVTLYERLVGDMGTTDINMESEQAQIRWHCRYPDQPVRRHLIDNVLSSWLCYARWLTGNDKLAPAEVLLEHPEPAATQIAEYERIFHCPVRFGQPHSALVGAPDLLMLPTRQPDPLLLSTLEAHATAQLAQLGIETSLSQRVRQCIKDAIGHTLPRKEAVAERLGMNIRTLHRHLADEGQSWQKLLDEIRLDQAKQLLRNTDQAQTFIADALGYSDIRSFQRSFKRHTGQTPGQFRKTGQTL